NIPKETKVNHFEKNDVLFSNIRTYFKKLWRAEFSGGASNDVLIIRSLNSDKMSNEYLYYVLSEERFFDYTVNTSKGTKMPRGDKSAIMQYDFDLPPLKTQQKIASILSSLDDKIELNNEMNKTLEEMAQTLFKRWFIDSEFPNEDGEPYRSSGGKMVESELGEIPEGWEVGSLQNIGLIVSGGTPSKSKNEYYITNGIPWITPKDLSMNKNKFIIRGTLDISEEGLNKSSAKLLPKGTVLFSSRAPIGYLAIAEADITTNQGFKSIIPYNFENTEFIYQLLKVITPYIESVAGGSTFKEISSQGMKSINIIIPLDLTLKKFYQITNSFNKKILNLEKEIQYLTKIRDTLLPKLMSGEIELSEGKNERI
ncbi:MAG: restriction endonuclease subunit S, partial [Cetobacterium sp.]